MSRNTNNSPIFMIGTQRSGSNLLRLMLNQLPEVASPHPPHILQRMMPLLPRYGDLTKPDAFARLVNDVCQLVELNPVPWEGVTLNRKEVAARCREENLVAVFGAVYDIMAEKQGAQTWCCKSLANIFYADAIEAYYPKARYIYLYRDGRDVAVSFRKAVVGEKHFYHIAKEWHETQQLALGLRARIPRQRFFSLSYEQLTEAPEKTAHALCKYLGVPYRDSMLDFHRSEEAKRAAASSNLWGNVSNPLMSNNTRKFLKEAAEGDIRVFEATAGDSLKALGYELTFKQDRVLRFSPEEVKHFDAENKRLKEETKRRVDPADLERRSRQEKLLQEIAARA